MSLTKNKILERLANAKGFTKKGHAKERRQKRPTNHVILVLDESGSMFPLRHDAVLAFQEQVKSIKLEARKARQSVTINTITFNHTIKDPTNGFNVEAYKPSGSTDLWGAIIRAIEFGNKQATKNDNVLIVVITDGEHNICNTSRSDVQNVIGTAMSNPNFSIVANVPPRHRNYLIDIGVPASNVREWEQTSLGLEILTQGVTRGYSGYFNAVSQGFGGQVSTQSFMANMDAVTPNDVNRMDDVSDQFKRWRVGQVNDGMEIAEFVRQQGYGYSVGRAFYELTKPEKVSAKKQLLILDKKTGALYSGDQARKKLGLPLNQDVKLKPGTQGEFTLFVESTSYNRHLVGNTTLLYRI